MNRSSEICLIVTSLVQLVFFVQATNFLKQKEVNLQMCSENNNITTAYGFCPPWAICREKGCKCRKLQDIYIKCGRNHTTLQTCACLSFDDDSRQFKIGRCIFSCKLSGLFNLRSVQSRIVYILEKWFPLWGERAHSLKLFCMYKRFEI